MDTHGYIWIYTRTQDIALEGYTDGRSLLYTEWGVLSFSKSIYLDFKYILL